MIWEDRESIEEAVRTADSRVEAIRNLGYNPKGSVTRKKLNKAIKEFNIDTSHFMYNTDWEALPNVIDQCFSIADVLRAVGLQDKGNNHQTAKKHLKRLGLNTDHFVKYRPGPKKSYDEVFSENSNVSRTTLRDWIRREDILDEGKCYECGIKSWNDKPITMQLEHVNGVSNDNREENLTYLCPNCHSQTDTWGRKSRSVG